MKKGLYVSPHQFKTFAEMRRDNLGGQLAVRSRTWDISSLFGYLPNPDPVLKKMGKNIKIYNDILVDAHVGSCVVSRKSGVKSLEWQIDRGKAQSRQARFFRDLFNDLDVEGITGEILNAPLFGYQPLEVIWEKVGGVIVPAAVVGKPQEWFVFDNENRLKLKTKQNPRGEDLPEKKFLLARHEPTYMNPYGFPILSRCFWPHTFKKGGYKFWVVFTEKYGMPWVVGKHPRGIDRKEVDELADTLEAMIQDAVAAIPDDSSVDIIEAAGKGNSADIYEKLLRFSNAEISKAILGQTLTTEVGDKGSYAASKTHGQVRQDIIDADKKLAAKIFNTLIRWTHEYNFASGEPPLFDYYEEEDVKKDLSERDKTLSDTGQVRFTKTYFIRNYGFNEDEIVVEQTQPAQPAQFSEPAPDNNPYAEIEQLLNALPQGTLQAQAEQALKPVIDLINRGSNYQQIMEKLASTYTMMDAAQLEEMLRRMIFIADVWGRIKEQGAA